MQGGRPRKIGWGQSAAADGVDGACRRKKVRHAEAFESRPMPSRLMLGKNAGARNLDIGIGRDELGFSLPYIWAALEQVPKADRA